jgi:molybdopterin synthase sulfur carrier subunit
VVREERDAMTVRVRIPSQLRGLTGGSSEVELEATTLRSLLEALEEGYPGFASRLLDDEGGLRRFINVFVADEDVRLGAGLDTAVSAGETVSIVPAVAGG